jgi:hypothetical protein
MTDEGLHLKSRIAAELAYRDARIAELEAVVDKLPKTADGVPVTCGDTVYCWAGGEASPDEAVYPLEVQQSRGILLVGRLGGYRSISNYQALDSRCYSTRAAAEAAKGGEG